MRTTLFTHMPCPHNRGTSPSPKVHSSQAPPLQHRCFPCPGLLRLLIGTVLPLGMGVEESPPPPPAARKHSDQGPCVLARGSSSCTFNVMSPWLSARAGLHGTLTWGPRGPAPWTAAAAFPRGAPAASPCPPGHPCRSVASVRLPGENPIHPDTQHRWPRPRQALGDKGPLLSLAGPGTGTGPAQQAWTPGHPRSRTMRGKGCGQADGTEPPPWPQPHPGVPSPAPSLSFTILSCCTGF